MGKNTICVCSAGLHARRNLFLLKLKPDFLSNVIFAAFHQAPPVFAGVKQVPWNLLRMTLLLESGCELQLPLLITAQVYCHGRIDTL